jgi:hypothetical protein
MRGLRAFGRFWLDFLVGDDWRIAAGVVAVLGAGAAAVRADAPEGVICVLVAAAIAAVFVVSVVFSGYEKFQKKEDGVLKVLLKP